ncbi:MAG: hypothetical protein ACD_29C00196G0001 [uncultured bacterium]|nr:MAG: hypothetical protein ACD_29C00196G0001 [uncultured bacterium]
MFIFVDASKYKQTPVFSVSHLNYLSLFLKTPEFKSIWKSYHYFGTINANPYYKLNVYELSNATTRRK